MSGGLFAITPRSRRASSVHASPLRLGRTSIEHASGSVDNVTIPAVPSLARSRGASRRSRPAPDPPAPPRLLLIPTETRPLPVHGPGSRDRPGSFPPLLLLLLL